MREVRGSPIYDHPSLNLPTVFPRVTALDSLRYLFREGEMPRQKAVKRRQQLRRRQWLVRQQELRSLNRRQKLLASILQRVVLVLLVGGLWLVIATAPKPENSDYFLLFLGAVFFIGLFGSWIRIANKLPPRNGSEPCYFESHPD
jgi:hypothetical protein